MYNMFRDRACTSSRLLHNILLYLATIYSPLPAAFSHTSHCLHSSSSSMCYSVSLSFPPLHLIFVQLHYTKYMFMPKQLYMQNTHIARSYRSGRRLLKHYKYCIFLGNLQWPKSGWGFRLLHIVLLLEPLHLARLLCLYGQCRMLLHSSQGLMAREGMGTGLEVVPLIYVPSLVWPLQMVSCDLVQAT